LSAEELARLRADLVRGAVLLATRGRLSRYVEVRYAVEAAGLPSDAETLWALLQNAAPDALCDDDVFDRFWSAYGGSSSPSDEQRALSARANRAGAAYGRDGDRLRALAGVRVPCMVVAFADDVNIPPALNREVAEAVPGCEYVEIAGAGHSGGVTHRHEVRRHVLPFLSRS
jgi:pimeloyl-ACP methyl ester carboxylesterase